MDCLARISSLAAARGWSMYTLAQMAGIPQSTLSNLFIRCNAPSVPTLEKLCGAFGITLSDFFSTEGDSLDNKEAELLSAWRSMSGEAKEHLLALLRSLTK